MHRIVLALLALGTAAPAAGQEWLVNRDRFRYIGTRLTIDVDVPGPGRLQVLRGQDGWLGVAGRAPAGLTAAGLTDDDHLTLSALGPGPVDYMVTVPEGVWVSVRLPDRVNIESVGGYTRLRTFDWQPTVAAAPVYGAPPAGTPGGAPPGAPLGAAPGTPAAEYPALLAATDDAGLFTTYAADLAPRTVALPDLRAVRALTVRTGADRFRIATSRPLSLQEGSRDRFEIRPAGDPMEVVIELPVGTAEFGLSAGGVPALLFESGTLTARCGPLTRQWLSGGREWVTFTPVDGRLECGPEPTPRHKG